jgi:hypothetical protein
MIRNTIVTAVMFLTLALPSLAAPTNMPNHPRRDQVNGRRNMQHSRIANGVKTGQITASEHQQLATEGTQIRNQEHADVKANGGYLTKSQQQQLNQEQNQRSQQIYQDKHN